MDLTIKDITKMYIDFYHNSAPLNQEESPSYIKNNTSEEVSKRLANINVKDDFNA
jgi:hypothetical protein